MLVGDEIRRSLAEQSSIRVARGGPGIDLPPSVEPSRSVEISSCYDNRGSSISRRYGITEFSSYRVRPSCILYELQCVFWQAFAVISGRCSHDDVCPEAAELS